jgi:hypothetical protein
MANYCRAVTKSLRGTPMLKTALDGRQLKKKLKRKKKGQIELGRRDRKKKRRVGKEGMDEKKVR